MLSAVHRSVACSTEQAPNASVTQMARKDNRANWYRKIIVAGYKPLALE